MTMRPTFRLPLMALSAMMLVSCGDGSSGRSGDDGANGQGGDATSASASSSQIEFSESAWLTVGNDGGVQTTMLDADGRYRDMRNGTLLASGNWQARPDGKLCFEPDAGRGDCWETGALGEDGSTKATNGDGKTISIKRINYSAADAQDAASAPDTPQ